MKIDQLSKILFVQALEESDLQGRHLPFSTRHHATQQAREEAFSLRETVPETGNPFLIKRTEIMWRFLHHSFPALTRSWESMQIDVPAIFVAAPAFIVGLLINGLGDSQRINLLNFPLLFLVIWNMSVYLGTVVMRGLKSSRTETWLERPALRLAQLAGEVRGKGLWQKLNSSNPPAAQWLQGATKRYLSLLWAQAGPLWIRHVRQLLHVGAAWMAIGIVLSMYVRGLVLDFQATWESTFLSPDHVQTILHAILGPAAWLLQYSFPTVPEVLDLQSPRHGPAAPWIHMWAVTTLAVIILPRWLLAWLDRRSVLRAGQNLSLPLKEPYFVHLLAPDRGQGLQVNILPYSYRPSPRTKEFLEKCFLDLFGNLAVIHWEDPLPFGEEFHGWPQASTPAQTLILLFHAGQTPEMEVHGELLHAIQSQRDPQRPGCQLLLLLDEEPYRPSVGKERVTERQQAWQRLINQYHLHMVPFDVQVTSPDQLIQQAHEGMGAASR